jgi:hypothetical protein
MMHCFCFLVMGWGSSRLLPTVGHCNACPKSGCGDHATQPHPETAQSCTLRPDMSVVAGFSCPIAFGAFPRKDGA